MEFFRIRKDIPFMKYAVILNAISLILFLSAVFFLITRGLHLSVEFTGGTVVEVNYQQAPDIEHIRTLLAKEYGDDVSVQSFDTATDVTIRLPVNPRKTTVAGEATENAEQQKQDPLAASQEHSKAVMQILRADNPEVQVTRVEYVGPVIGDELVHKGLFALGLVVFGVIVYLAFRFEWKFGVAGILANLHDVVIILGFFAFFQWEFSLSVLAATLAVLGYSVNESVVIFDRIREAFRRYRKMTTQEVINHAITSTMSRTIITHGSTEAVVLSMFFVGGPTLHYFALALVIGILFGIYSSVFVAAALVMWLGVKREDFIKEKKARPSLDDPSGGVVV